MSASGTLRCALALSLALTGCIGRSLVDDGGGGGQETNCAQPPLHACERLALVPAPLSLSEADFAPDASLRTCMESGSATLLTDQARTHGLSLHCRRHDVALEPGAVTVLDSLEVSNAALFVQGDAHAVLELRRPRGDGLHIVTSGQVSVVITQGELERVTVDLDRDATDAQLALDQTEIDTFAARGPALAELRARDCRVAAGAIALGRLTFERTELSDMALAVDDLLVVDGEVSASRLQVAVGAVHVSHLADTELVGCGQLLLAGGVVSGGYLKGCSEGPLQLDGVSVVSASKRPEDLVPVVGPVQARDSDLQGAIVGGMGFARGISLVESSVTSAVLCDLSVVNALQTHFSCAVCAQDAAFHVCSEDPSTLTHFDTACPPLRAVACTTPQGI